MRSERGAALKTWHRCATSLRVPVRRSWWIAISRLRPLIERRSSNNHRRLIASPLPSKVRAAFARPLIFQGRVLMDLRLANVSHTMGGPKLLRDIQALNTFGRCLHRRAFGLCKSTLLRICLAAGAAGAGEVRATGTPPAGCLNPLNLCVQGFRFAAVGAASARKWRAGACRITGLDARCAGAESSNDCWRRTSWTEFLPRPCPNSFLAG